MPNLDPSQIRVAGTGAIWKAPAGTPLPPDSVTAWNAAFVHLGYAENGFTLAQDLKVQNVTGWQSLEPLLEIKQSIAKMISFTDLESDKQNYALAFGDATPTTSGTGTGGAVTFATGTITFATAHGFTVGQPIQFTAVTGTPGVVAGVTYWVLSVPTSTTMTIGATAQSTVALTIAAGTATAGINPSTYTIAIPDTPIPMEYAIGIDWSHGTYNQRFVIPRAVIQALPTIKYVRDDAVRFAVSLAILKPLDGSQSMVPYGLDWAANS